ncbi:MAG TPA: HAD family phosphatase [Herpetosiphonaceae bacterium]
MIAAVLFDLDGLLADSEPLQKRAWHRFVERYDRVLEPELIDRMFGLRLLDSAALVRQELSLPLSVEQVMAERDALFLDSLPGVLQPMPQASATVAAMHRLGLRTALATSGHQRYVTIALRELGLEHAFDAIVTGDTVTRGKPAPDIFLRAAELLDVSPAQCVVVEDAPHGIAAARAAGMFAVAVPNELTRDLDFGAAQMLCQSLGAFRVWIEQQQRQVGR